MTSYPRRRSRAAFTLVEVMVVSGLMTTLALVTAVVWSGLGRPLTEAAGRAHIAQEANLAAAALARDFGGVLPGSEGRLGGIANGRLVGRVQPNSSVLRLCFDGGTPNGIADWGEPDTVISYDVQDGILVRRDELAGTSFTVARSVQQIELTERPDGVEIRLTFSFRDLTSTYTIVGLDP